MPIFNSVEQAQTWCSQHFPSQVAAQVAPTTHWSLPHMDWFTIGFWAAIIAGVYMAGRIGLPQLWTDIKNVYASIRSYFSSSTPAQAAPATPANTTGPTSNPVA